MKIKIEATKLAPILDAYAKGSKRATMRALNHAGDKAHTRVSRVLAKVMGTSYGKMSSSLETKSATEQTPVYEISAQGGHLSLASFSPRQTKRGVTAAPWGVKRTFPGTFIIEALGGQVFRRASGKLVKLWGPSLPVELVREESVKAFSTGLEDNMRNRLEHELKRLNK
jgi:Prophage minor tail protein Z (GPZ)